jgi:ribonuclease R
VKPHHFQKLLRRLHGSPEERPVASRMLRTMQQARYDLVSLGHFGLATSTYTHFTSPIRRYPDLVVHRALRNIRIGRTATKKIESLPKKLSEVARHTSEMERRAENAEREIVQWKKVRFMADKVGNEFTGYVTGVTSFGLFIELVEYFVDGLVHISSMVDDYYHYMETQHALHGENTKKVYRLGDLVHVQLVRVDREHRKLELALVDVLDRIRLKNEHPDASQNTSSARSTRRRIKGSRARTRLQK